MKNLTNLRHLNNSNQWALKGMPPELGKLTNLQTLPKFVVGKENGSSGIGELGPLLHLRGTLSISGLENVKGAEDVAIANLAGKNDIDVLLLEWNKGEIASLNVLEMLQPPSKLKELIVMRYGGLKFPTWMGNPSFSNMVLMRLEDCKGCKFLPPLGQLASLKKLIIKGMSGIERVGSEFYGEGCLKPFPLLEILSFENMETWEDWLQLDCKAEIERFPQLKELSLRRCPKLNGKLPESLPSLATLVVYGCEQLVVSIAPNQMLCKLHIENCKEVVCENISNVSEFRYPAEGLTRLKDLKVYRCKEMSSVWQDELRQLTSLEHLEIDDSSLKNPTLQVGEEPRELELCLPTKVQTLVLSECDNLVKIPEGLHLTLLQELYIYDCPSLTCFPESGLPSSLRVLQIARCNNLISLVRDNEYSNNCTPPPNSNSNCVESLDIRGCQSLKSISSANGSLPASFKNIRIEHCGALECLSLGKLPGTLRNLEIKYCDSLIWLSSEGELPEALESLHITKCGMLTCLKSSSEEGSLPKALKSLDISLCRQLQSIADRFNGNTCLESVKLIDCGNLRSLPEGLHNLINLTDLRIEWCENLVSFPEGGLPTSNLRDLFVIHNTVVDYPEGMLQNLFFLQQLDVDYSEGLLRVLEQDGFPPNLTGLTINNLKVIKPLFQWRLLHRLTSLRELVLSGPATAMVSFPPEHEQQQEGRMSMMLPNSLITVALSNFENLDRLSSGFQCLTSLQYLSISNCKKLKYLPEEGLPLSLLKLQINGCPLLEKQCKRDIGPLWPLIANIPFVKFVPALPIFL